RRVLRRGEPGDPARLRSARHRQHRAARLPHPRGLRGLRGQQLVRARSHPRRDPLHPPLLPAGGRGLPRLLRGVRAPGGGVAARPRVLLRPALHHRGEPQPEIRGGLPSGGGVLHRQVHRVGWVGIAYRLLVPCVVGLLMTAALYLFLGRTFYGRAIMAVSQDAGALRLMGANPVRIKTIAFGIGIAAASLAGALLITIAPVVPSSDRDYIGRMFAITVLGGMGSIGGTLVAAVILGVVESLMGTFAGPSWSLAVSFGILLLALAVRPAGLFGR